MSTCRMAPSWLHPSWLSTVTTLVPTVEFHSALLIILALLCCQVLYMPGWIEEAAKALGEEGEQLFGYLSRFAPTTRSNGDAGEI